MLSAIKKKMQHVKVVMLTNFGTEADHIISSFEKDADAHIIKPKPDAFVGKDEEVKVLLAHIARLIRQVMPPSIFISHSSHDDKWVSELNGAIATKGFGTFVDHVNIIGGKLFWDEIESAISQCRAMIVVLSPHAVESKAVQAEWTRYLRDKNCLYPVIKETCTVPFMLEVGQQIDFRKDYDAALDRLVVALRECNC